jgi:predicted adenine nucleotide alpha hydrolase (AANH) superfamily ATPase
MKKLVHVCCANCLSDAIEEVARDGSEVVLLFANPNIHPLVEFRRRRKSVRLIAKRLGLDLEEAPYGLNEFLRSLEGRFASEDGRCRTCYRLRMEASAAKARDLGAASFTTTLLVSRAQERESVVEAGRAAGAAAGVTFEAPDIRELHGCDQSRPRDLKLYKQAYCGCIFSEEERFRDTTRGE